MTHYLVQPRYRIFVKSYRFLSFDIKMRKILVKIYVKPEAVNTGKNFMTMLKKSALDALKSALIY